MKFYKLYLALIFTVLITCFDLTAQTNITLSGSIRDQQGVGLPGAVIRVLKPDSVLLTGTAADAEGTFSLSVPANGNFILQASYSGFSGKGKFMKLITGSENISIAPITLKERARLLKEVDVTAVQTRGEQKGDTTQFNAAAYKTNPDATAEDLVKKMPGVTSDGEGMKVNGEQVQKVLVDGKPFLGDDPNATLRNLPADIIDKVEVFDKMSDQSAFTGFNDGNQQKTINLVTKKNKLEGVFGRLYAGAGADENETIRYNAGAALNSFKGSQRVTLLLLSNNVNQQNFSISDLAGVMNSGNQGGGRMGRMNSSLFASPQNGNTSTQSAGLNYSNEWGKKLSVSGSYFFNATENLANSTIERNYFTNNSLRYQQNSNSRTFNLNHRANARLEYTIDSLNKIIYTPSINIQNNDIRSILSGSNSAGDIALLSSTSTDSKTKNLAYDITNNLLYQHRFAKKGRTISFNVSNTLTKRDNNGDYYAYNFYSDTSSTVLDQTFVTNSRTRKTAANLSYTEPMGENGQIQINYSPAYTEANSDKQTNDFNAVTDSYSDFNSSLSNKYENYYLVQKAGLGYRYSKNKLNFNLGTDLQQSTLNGIQFYPYTARVNQTFANILPNAQLNYKFDKIKNLRVNYRTSTDIPTVSQLQNVIDVSNPLQIKSGNDSLKQTFENNLNIRLGGFNPASSRNLMVFMNLRSSANYISNATYILNRDTVLQGYLVNAGSQLTKPVNLNGYYNGRTFVTFGFPVKKLKSNINLNAGINYAHTPSLINDLLNESNSYASNGGLNLSSNVSEKLDFSIGVNSAYTIVKNSLQSSSDNNYYTQNSSAKLNWNIYKGLIINTDITHTFYKGLSQDFDQSFFLWNAYIGYKFLKNKSLEAKFYVYDILNQNRSISRTVNAAYTEDNYTNVLRRYGMLTLTYTFKKFKSGDAPKLDLPPGGMPGGMRPPGPVNPGN